MVFCALRRSKLFKQRANEKAATGPENHFSWRFHNSVQCAFSCYLVGLALFHFSPSMPSCRFFPVLAHAKCICIHNSLLSADAVFFSLHARCVASSIQSVRVHWMHHCLFYCGEAKWRIDDAIFPRAILICSYVWHIVFAIACAQLFGSRTLKLFPLLRQWPRGCAPFLFGCSFQCQREIVCLNIKLYYCIFWLCLVATLRFFGVRFW